VAPAELPSFDLVVATVDRVEELERLLASLQEQTHGAFRVLLIDQNADDRLAAASRLLLPRRLRGPAGGIATVD